MRPKIVLVVAVIAMLAIPAYPYLPGLSPTVQALSPPSQAQFSMGTPTYQFGSWPGAGMKLLQGPTAWTDAMVQQQYVPTASLGYPWGGFNYGTGGTNWCTDANTTSTYISGTNYGVGGTYSAWLEHLVQGYQLPFMVQEPMDGYGQCVSWSNAAKTQFPDLLTFNSTGYPVTSYSYVRVDSIHFGVQIFRDLSNIQANIRSVNPSILNQWQGVYVSSIGADHGGYPKPGTQNLTGNRFANYMFGANSIINFALSPQCTYQCAQILTLAQSGLLPQAISLIQNEYNSWETWTNSEMILGMTYAAYNFSQKYLGGKPFFVVPAFSFFLTPSQYPAPYNTLYIEGLNLLQKYELSVGAYVENGNPPTASSVKADLNICKGNAPYGNEGFFVTAGGTYTNPAFPQYVKNMVYYQAACAGLSIIAPGNLAYQPNTFGWSTMVAYGSILNRMRNLQTTDAASIPVVASSTSTGLTALSNGGTALAWFYTNSSLGDSATATLSASALGVASPWLAISALNWQVLGSGTTDTISLRAGIPPQGWNPVYIVSAGSTGKVEYSNSPVTSVSSSLLSNQYSVSSPHAFSGWLVIRSSAIPTSVTTENMGILPQYSSLSSLNRTVIGMQWTGTTFVNQTQGGWYFDATNGLIYIHCLGSGKVLLSIFNSGSTTTSSSSTSSTTSSTTSGSLTSTSSSTSSSTSVSGSSTSTSTGYTTTRTTSTGSTTFSTSSMASSSTTVVTTSGISLSSTTTSRSSSTGLQNYQSPNYILSVQATPSYGGSVYPPVGAYNETKGDLLTFKAFPNQGWRLTYWLLNGTTSYMPVNFTAKFQGNTRVTAIFAVDGFSTSLHFGQNVANQSMAGYAGQSDGIWVGPFYLQSSSALMIAGGILIVSLVLGMARFHRQRNRF